LSVAYEPATGNFTRIVQRVPVRIRLDCNQPGSEKRSNPEFRGSQWSQIPFRSVIGILAFALMEEHLINQLPRRLGQIGRVKRKQSWTEQCRQVTADLV
jgi:hypothetical protein